MNEDVAGLLGSRWGSDPASTIRTQAAEIERLTGEAKIEAALLSEWMAANAELETKLREAVEVIRAARRHNDNPRFYNSAIEDVTAAFLATMEQEDSTSE
jgi:hypothetical protein